MKLIRALAFLVVSCALAPSLAAAAPARTVLPKAASTGEIVAVPGTSEKAELVSLDSSLADSLLRVRLEDEVAVAGWPVAPGERADVVLTRRDVYAPGAEVLEVTREGTRRLPKSSLVFLLGKAEGSADVRVMVSVDPATQEMRGFTITPKGAHELALVPKSWHAGNRYVVGPHDLFLDDDGKAVAKDWKCGVENLSQLDFAAPLPVEKSLVPSFEDVGLSTLHTATVAVDTDNQIMANKFGNNTTTATNYIASLFAQMTVIYERDLLVRLLQGTTFLRTSTDPYTVNDTPPYSDDSIGDKLNELTNYWSANEGSVNRAITVMLSGRGGAGAAGIAWVDVLCNPSVGYVFSRVSTTGTTTNLGDVMVTAHEIGHNFGSPHTHCYNTIGLANPDNCFSGETFNGQACFSGATICPNLPNGTTYNGVTGVFGTLMSYCHLLGGCPFSASFLVFHPTTVSLLGGKVVSHSTGAGACILPLAAPGPTVVSVSPNNGPTTGNKAVTITGTNFQSGATVTFGTGGSAVAGTSVVVVNATTITAVAPAHATGAVRVTVTNTGNVSGFLDSAYFYAPAPVPASFYTLTPCRILDTRNAAGPLGGPSLAANATRTFTVTGVCGIPAGAVAISANVTVVAGSATGVFSIYPGNAFPLGPTTLNFSTGQIRANNAILKLATDGTGTMGVLNASASSNQLLVDVNGYWK
jgi:hypothetical protein